MESLLRDSRRSLDFKVVDAPIADIDEEQDEEDDNPI
jgi:hypothetical protein